MTSFPAATLTARSFERAASAGFSRVKRRDQQTKGVVRDNLLLAVPVSFALNHRKQKGSNLKLF
jgi:hypothetical protein